MDSQKSLIEDVDSWTNHLERSSKIRQEEDRPDSRRLHHHHKHDDNTALANVDPLEAEAEFEAAYWKKFDHAEHKAAKIRKAHRRRRKEAMKELWRDSGVGRHTVHGLMIDAGSTGSRLHVYEWEPRTLKNEQDIQLAVAGEKLSFPGTNTRWTDRLQPGISTFGNLPDDELPEAIAEYLKPLLDFAKTVMHSKKRQFADFPIYLRATAGMRILNPTDRARVIGAVRDLFGNKTYCPFAFVDEQARVLSGEEEAIYDWAGVNFLSGDLIEDSEGAGTVVNPRLTQGALDLGGGSTQIGFYEPTEDVMSNLFKLQIGQAKHWNVYTHSFLFYGMNEAINRFGARLVAGKSSEERLIKGVYNPCLPGGVKRTIRTDIHVDENGVETWDYDRTFRGEGFYQAILTNENKRPDFDQCMNMTKSLLHLEKNDWCNFAHGDCSFAGIYQPELPTQYEGFGEFLAFSNYYHVWRFLKLPELATLNQLENATRYACSLTRDELVEFNNGKDGPNDDLDGSCFRSTYVFQLLRNGFGFQMTDSIRAVKVVNSHKVGWALGAMLYEINALPWDYLTQEDKFVAEKKYLQFEWDSLFVAITIFVMFAVLFSMYLIRRRRQHRADHHHQYEQIADAVVETSV